MIRKILEKLITNNYAINYNRAGRAAKRAFKSLKTKNFIELSFFIFSLIGRHCGWAIIKPETFLNICIFLHTS